MKSFDQMDNFDLSSETCSVPVQGETCYGRGSHGSGDGFECSRQSSVICASEDCSCCPCEGHVKYCPTCGQPFCESSDRLLWTCFSQHLEDGQCQKEILRIPLGKLQRALASGNHPKLSEFVQRNSDGLGYPLPPDVCRSFGFAVACLNEVIPDYNQDVLLTQKETRLKRRTDTQRIRRAVTRLNLQPAFRRIEGRHLSPYRNSTIHLATGALTTLHWTGNWHYREQLEMLDIMGLAKSQDFIRDRVDYLRRHNPEMFDLIESRAASISRERPVLKPKKSQF